MTSAAPVPDFSADIGNGIDGLRIGIPDRYFNVRLTPSVAAAVSSAIERLADAGALIQPVRLPMLDHALDVHLLTILAEAAAYHRGRFPDGDARYGADVRTALELGDRISASDFLQAQRLRRTALREMLEAFNNVDLLVTPTLPTEAPTVGQDSIPYPDGEEDSLTSLIRFTCPFNQTGLPAISIPIAGGVDHLPVGLQLVAPPFREALVIRAAAAAQAMDGLSDRRPALVRNGS
jgi:aspartyl-tRNA(Asn)/glutamyl-tRNA(Gln) amidotransferase subunit A